MSANYLRAVIVSLSVLLLLLLVKESASQPDVEKRKLFEDLVAAQQKKDQETVEAICQKIIAKLGDLAGIPEVPDEYLTIPREVKPLSELEKQKSFDRSFEYTQKQKWWGKNSNPTQLNHALREIATILDCYTFSKPVIPNLSELQKSLVQELIDFLLQAQDQAEVGLFPFPALRNGKGRPFEVSERFYRQAEKQKRLNEVIRNGWAVDDFLDGGLQFDNGLSGVALLHYYEQQEKSDKILKAALRAADWTINRPIVTNWNYNSFSVYLLAEAYRVSRSEKYLQAACEKMQIGVLPGQLTAGPHKGRWADAHNARPAYHYILLRSMASLLHVLPADHPLTPTLIDRLKLGLLARNPEYHTKGIINSDSALEALMLVDTLPEIYRNEFAGCQVSETIAAIERFAIQRYREGKPAVSPGIWAKLLVRSKSP